ncbi:MAG: AAA family ATPase [Succinivibrio sp.]|nr:AAA family ATPase [Succinivibrio sp.]
MITHTTLYSNLHEVLLADYLFIDNSNKLVELVHRLDETPVHSNANVFLLNRPRGFGLSLAVQAICEILTQDDSENRKHSEEKTKTVIAKRHVLTLNLKKVKAKTPRDFSQALITRLQELYWEHHIEARISPYDTPKTIFSNLLWQLYQRHHEPTVVLIDNYDIPFIITSDMEEQYRLESISIYLEMLNVLRHSHDSVRWCLLTGHIKFALASELSEGIPYANDLSNDPICETLFGFTREEVMSTFSAKIKRFADERGITKEEYLDLLEKCYGGFSFSDNLVKVMCPACISHAFNNNGILCTYSAGGDYTFLKKVLRDRENDLEWLYERDGQDPLFSNCIDTSPKSKDLGTLLIQLGFATRDKVTLYDHQGYATWRYRFVMPNEDMKRTLDIITGLESPDKAFEPISFPEDILREDETDTGSSESQTTLPNVQHNTEDKDEEKK